MRAHLLQYEIAWEDKAANHETVRRLISAASPRENELVILPEMFDTGFSLNVETTSDEDETSTRFLADMARSQRIYLMGGLTKTGPDQRGRNRALVFNPAGDQIACYDKIHPFSFGREPERFTGGDQVVFFDWTDGAETLRVGLAICYDLRFPELFRAGLALGAEVFALGANWPAPRTEHWRTLLRARAIENEAFVLGVNRCGADPHLAYDGASAAIDPQGEPIAEAGDAERTLSVELDIAALRHWRERFPAWRDGKPGLLPHIGRNGRF